jgi:hypothetical protein
MHNARFSTSLVPCQKLRCYAAAGLPYVLEEQRDLSSLVKAHQAYQTQVLAGNTAGSSSTVSRAVPAILVAAPDGVAGIGNRLPSIVTAYVMALFTQRVLLIDAPALLKHLQVPFPCDWQQHKAVYSRGESNTDSCVTLGKVAPSYGHVQYCGVSEHSSVSTSSTQFGISNSTSLQDAPLIKYRSADYDMPLLQINPEFASFFDKFFPSGEVFHQAAQHLFSLAPAVLQAMSGYLVHAGDCSVGLQMRHKKPYGSEKLQVEQFAGIARMLLRQHLGTVHLASDTDNFERMAALVGPQLRWSNLTRADLNMSTAARNPGTELSAFVDIFLLARCKAIVVTPASSFGAMAAAIAGVKPVYATYGRHAAPFINPWFWQSVTSEPCMFKASKTMDFGGEVAARLKEKYPFYMFQMQCHH